MTTDIEYGPAFAWVRVGLEAGEQIDAEAGAMVMHTSGIDMKTRLNAPRKGGLFARFLAFFTALFRKIFGRETMFLNEFTAGEAGELVLAPRMSGTVHELTLDPARSYFVQAGSYLASSTTVQTKLRWGGLRTLFGGEGISLLQCYGTGELLINSYGGIEEIELDGDYVVDTGHLVAFEHSLDFKIKGAGHGVKGFLFSGEGLVMQFSGRGKLWIQSRNVDALVGWLTPMVR